MLVVDYSGCRRATAVAPEGVLPYGAQVGSASTDGATRSLRVHGADDLGKCAFQLPGEVLELREFLPQRLGFDLLADGREHGSADLGSAAFNGMCLVSDLLPPAGGEGVLQLRQAFGRVVLEDR